MGLQAENAGDRRLFRLHQPKLTQASGAVSQQRLWIELIHTQHHAQHLLDSGKGHFAHLRRERRDIEAGVMAGQL